MEKIIRYEKNGITVIGEERLANREDQFELCNKCTKRNKQSSMRDCYIYSKIKNLASMFSVTIPVFSCLSFEGEITKPVIEKDSCEGE